MTANWREIRIQASYSERPDSLAMQTLCTIEEKVCYLTLLDSSECGVKGFDCRQGHYICRTYSL